MICLSQDELRSYLSHELPVEAETCVDEHVRTCDTCRHALDDLTSDDLVRDYVEASRRQTSSGGDVGGQPPFANSEAPEWRPFGGDECQLPLRFGRYVLKETLGAGGFGVVYLAEDLDLAREVAVKIPHLGGLSPSVRQRFIQEGAAAANLHHPHIVQAHHAGAYRGVCFLVSEYCPGQTLRQLLDERGALGPRQAVQIVAALAEAVDHAHQHKVVHRDIKPANVILDSRSACEGLSFCPKLTDFGTARVMGAERSLTTAVMLIGTAPYMAPEQVSETGEVGPACDLYALGVLLYEMISGQAPLEGGDSADTIRKIASTDAPPLHRQAPGVSRDLSAICACCLERTPERRYASAKDLALDLRRFLNHQPTKARPLHAAAQIVRWSLRNPRPLAIMGAICLVFAAAIWGLAWHTARLGEVNQRLTASNQQALLMKKRAQLSELHARRLAYTSDMRLAEKLWREGDLQSARAILAGQAPGSGLQDLRGVEWHFLERAVKPRSETIVEIASPLYFVRLSPDQKSFATAGQDGVIRLYDRESGDLREAIKSGQGEVNSVAFSPDGGTLASAGDDGSVCLWRLADAARADRLAAHDGLAFGVEFTPDGKRLVSCGSDGHVHVWRNGEREATYSDHTSRVEAIAVSPNGRWLASVGKDGKLVVRELGAREPLFKWGHDIGTLSSVAFSPDSKTIAVTEASGETMWMRLFDLTAKSLVLERQHPDAIRSVTFSPDGEWALTTDNAGTARIWDVSQDSYSSELPLRVWSAHDQRVYSAVFEPGGATILTAAQDGQVRRSHSFTTEAKVIDRSEIARSVGIYEPNMLIHDIKFLPNNRDIAAAAHLGFLIIQPHAIDATKYRRPAKDTIWTCIAAPRQSDWIVAAGATVHPSSGHPAVLERWEPKTSQRQSLLSTQAKCTVYAIRCSPAGDLLAAMVDEHAADDVPKRLLLLDAHSGDILHEFPAAAGTRPRFTPDGQVLVYGVQRDIHLVDLHSLRRRVIRDAHVNSQSGMAVSDDGKWIATCDEGRELKIWNLATLRRQATLQGHQGKITALEFSSDSRTLLSSSHDGTVKAWSVATGKFLMNLHLGEEGVSDMAVSADGNHLAVVEDRRRIRFYRLGQPAETNEALEQQDQRHGETEPALRRAQDVARLGQAKAGQSSEKVRSLVEVADLDSLGVTIRGAFADPLGRLLVLGEDDRIYRWDDGRWEKNTWDHSLVWGGGTVEWEQDRDGHIFTLDDRGVLYRWRLDDCGWDRVSTRMADLLLDDTGALVVIGKDDKTYRRREGGIAEMP